jgi:hypothetical protein
MERLVARVGILCEVAVDRYAFARWTLVDVVVKVLAIALTVHMFKEFLSVMNGDAPKGDSIAALKADF